MDDTSTKISKAVFLDRDGTINQERHYLADPDKVVLFLGAGKSLRALQDLRFLLVIVTNQSGIGRGFYTLDDMHRVNARVVELLADDGVRFERIYFAPEAPDQPSRGRKPSPNFLFDARDEFGVDLSHSYMIGDKVLDLECGWNAGVRKSLLVRTGYGSEVEKNGDARLTNAAVVDGLPEAAEWIRQDVLSFGLEAGRGKNVNEKRGANH